MKQHFNSREVFEIAQNMELDGIAFYTKAAEKVKNKAMKQLLQELAGWEKKHYDFFGCIKDQIVENSGEQLLDRDNEAAMYLNTLVAGAIFDKDKGPEQFLSDCNDEIDILNVAVGMEKNSIAYYLGLKEYVSSDSDKAKVDEIIREEMRHVRILTEKINEFNQSAK